MRGWLLFHRDLDPGLPEVAEILRFQESAVRAGIALEVLKPHLFDLVVAPVDGWNLHYGNRLLERPDFIVCRTGAETDYFTLAVLRHFERRGVRLINGSDAIERVADKLHTTQLLSRAGLPVPKTILGKFPMDSDLVERELGFPVIVKTLRGTRGTGVAKCEDRAQFEDLAGLLASADAQAEFLFQHYVRASHGRDVRVLVVGGKIVAAMERRSLTGSFKSNVSLGGIGSAFQPPPEMARLAVAAAQELGLDIAGIDILFDEEGYRICEANSAPGFQGLEAACRIDVPGLIFDWIEAELAPLPVAAAPAEPAGLRLIAGSRRHLSSVGESYFEHLHFATSVGVRMTFGGLACILHGLVPALLTDRGSRTIIALHGLLTDRRAGGGDVRAHQEARPPLVPLLLVAIWTALVPWLAGVAAPAAAALSLLALAFPVAFLLAERSPERATEQAAGVG